MNTEKQDKVHPRRSSMLKEKPLALGTNVFGWTVPESVAFNLLDCYVDHGFSLIDTANVYPYWASGCVGGESESIIGKWIRRRPGGRSKLIIATKVGFSIEPGSGGLSRRTILREIDASLARLRTDYVDIYKSHVEDQATPLEETLETYSDLIRVGKVRMIGASNHGVDSLDKALTVSLREGYAKYEVVQPQYNLFHRQEYELSLRDYCSQHNIAVWPYFSLASGFLTGKYHSKLDFLANRRGQFVRDAWDVDAMFNDRGMKILDALDVVARQHKATSTQIAIAWLVAQGVKAPIASATSNAQLYELMQGANLKLLDSGIKLLNTASS